MPDLEPFLLAGPPEVVRAVVDAARTDPDIEVTAITGPEVAPQRITLRATADRADRLRREWGDRVHIEADEEIYPAAVPPPDTDNSDTDDRGEHDMAGRSRRPGTPAAAAAPETPPTGPRPKPYLVGRREGLMLAGADTVPFDDVLDQLQQDPAVQVERVIEPTGLALLADTPGPLQRVVVARMTDGRARELDDLHPHVLVEEDALVRPVPAAPPVPADVRDPGMVLPFGGSTTWDLLVIGADGTPVAGAVVQLHGAGVPAQGRTDERGEVSLSLLNETDDTLRALFVNPQAGHWGLWIDDPQLVSGVPNTVQLRPLASTLEGFPDSQLLGWGQRAMRLDQLDPRFDGAGVRVAVIDSGADTEHPDLAAIKAGRDFTTAPASSETWVQDTMAHGSHCTGVIAGADGPGGIRGFAPAADVHELRIFPGGRFSTILDALDYCIQQQVDVVNMSLGSAAGSEMVLQKLAQARQAGVACIVAAGNSAGPVQFPATSPDVLAVAAVGRLGEFPADSYHARQVPPDGPTDRGYFSAAFSCHGPEVDVCAPGVAIVSSVPSAGFAAWDGTSMAAPHVTGLATLVLAHHPDLADGQGRGTAARVDQLFAVLRASATPLDLGDPGRTGAGMPDAVRAVTGQPAAPATTPAGTGGALSDAVTALLHLLRAEYAAAGLV